MSSNERLPDSENVLSEGQYEGTLHLEGLLRLGHLCKEKEDPKIEALEEVEEDHLPETGLDLIMMIEGMTREEGMVC